MCSLQHCLQILHVSEIPGVDTAKAHRFRRSPLSRQDLDDMSAQFKTVRSFSLGTPRCGSILCIVGAVAIMADERLYTAEIQAVKIALFAFFTKPPRTIDDPVTDSGHKSMICSTNGVPRISFHTSGANAAVTCVACT